MIYAALLMGCLLLYKGGDWLLDGRLGTGHRYHLPKAIVGLLLVSLGTSAPELFVSVGSAIQNHGGMAAGNVVGSNIINIAIVLGIIVCLVALTVDRILRNQLLAVIIISLAAVWFMSDGVITRFEGLGLIVLMLVSFWIALKQNHKNKIIEEPVSNTNPSTKQSILLTIAGIIALIVGAEALILGGLGLAAQLNLSKTVVALTVTALGTSLPEIAASIVAVSRRETSLALGNVIGSNMLNLGFVLGVSALITPLTQVEVDTFTLTFFVGLVAVIFVFSVKPGFLPKWTGYLLVLSYFAYVTWLVST